MPSEGLAALSISRFVCMCRVLMWFSFEMSSTLFKNNDTKVYLQLVYENQSTFSLFENLKVLL